MLTQGGVALVAGGLGARAALAAGPDPIKLGKLLAPTENEPEPTPPPDPPAQRVGFAIVGLGHLALGEILPAFGETKHCRPAALVSGDRAKATVVADRYGIGPRHIYDYKSFDRLRDDPDVQVVYVVLPNGLHAEYTVRAAQAGKHILCEKPMATSVAECRQMIEAAHKAERRLMIAYRLQYEPYNREAIRLARSGALGRLKAFTASNGQAQGDPKQWRLNKKLAGGGALVDVGIYCVNAARYLSGDEPTEVSAFQHSTPRDPRFLEVEEQVDFLMRFPSGFAASCTTSYGYHGSKRFRLMGDTAWLDLDPAFPYRGQLLRIGRKGADGQGDVIETRLLGAKNHFALEMDHMARAVRENRRPHTPGEEGMQDVGIIAALYEAAAAGRVIKLPPAARPDAFRGDPV